jgi:hypothetical protein
MTRDELWKALDGLTDDECRTVLNKMAGSANWLCTKGTKEQQRDGAAIESEMAKCIKYLPAKVIDGGKAAG